MKKILLFSAFGLISCIACQAQIITTIAGNSTSSGYTGDGGQATAATFYNPIDLAIDASGNIYIADQGNNVVRKVNSAGIVSTFAGNGTGDFMGDGGPATAAELWSPCAVCLDASGNVYIGDYFNNRVRKVNTSGIISTVVGSGAGGYTGDGGPAIAAEIGGAISLSMDASGNMYIADINNQVIRKVNASGTISTFAGNGLMGYSGDGGAAISAKLSSPQGVWVDGGGNLYIADENNNAVRMVNTSGIITTIAGTGTLGYSGDGGQATAAEIYGPNGVCTDAGGNVYIADSKNDVIRKVSTSGIITTIAGVGFGGYSGDGGPATAAELSYSRKVYVSGSGNVYIPDWGNNVVREVMVANSVDDIYAKKTSLFPNPTINILYIKCPIAVNAVITGMDGHIVCSVNSVKSIDLSHLVSGMYLITLYDNQTGAILKTEQVVKRN